MQETTQLEFMKSYLKKIDCVIENGVYKDDWKSLSNHKVPDWYQDAKFGIFIHWGPYSLAEYGNEWYPRFMYQPNMERRGQNYYEHHKEVYGEPKEFGYKDMIPMFQAEKFDAASWAELFQESGAKFVMPVAEHHDGFQMYDSEISDWCASKMGPKKDVMGILKEEVEKRDMIFTASSHRVEHYWFLGGGRLFDSDMPPAGEEIPYGDLYWPSVPDDIFQHHEIDTEVDTLFMEDWLVRTCEIVDKYKPKILYFDWWIQVLPMKPYLKKFAAYYYNRANEWGQEVTVVFKHDAYAYSSGIRTIERGQLANISPNYWQIDTSVAKNSWSYTKDNDYKSSYEILCDLIDAVSKNGSMLLNIGPKADGTIPKEDEAILRQVGKWMKVNGEGIYDTTFWKVFGEGPTQVPDGFFTERDKGNYTSEDFRFTYKEGNIYAFSMKWSADGVARIKSLGQGYHLFKGYCKTAISKVEVFGSKVGCNFIHSKDYLTVICSDMEEGMPVCIKVTVE
ncbi:MAG: alpha-L-fucosidase [Eubacteriales bacterium]